MGQLWDSDTPNCELPNVIPVMYFCSGCGWFCSIESACGRCGDLYQKKISMQRPIFTLNSGNESASGYFPEADGIERFEPFNSNKRIEKIDEKNEQTLKQKNFKQKLKNVNRRSRAYSRQFVMQVMIRNEMSIPELVVEEEFGATARPVVNKIVELAKQYLSWKNDIVLRNLQELIEQEKHQGTEWRELADETIMELIINEVDAFHFVATLIKSYRVSYYDFGKFLATPPDEGTMSLIEEAVCQDLMDLFDDVLKMDEQVVNGLLESEEVSSEVRDILLSTIEQFN